jgi:hypothetical protein
MVKAMIRWLVILVLLACALPVAGETPRTAPQDGVVLRGVDFVELLWDADNYPGPADDPVVRWELHRGETANDLAEVARGASGDWYRDEGLARDTMYYYRLYVIRQADTGEEPYQVFGTSRATGALHGTVYHDLTVGGGPYPVDWVLVRQGASLRLLGTDVEGYDPLYPDTGWAYIAAREGGYVEISQATLERVAVEIGSDSGGTLTAGAGLIEHSVFMPAHLTVYADSTAEGEHVEVVDNTIVDHPDNRAIRLYNTSSALLQQNTGKVRLELSGEAWVTLEEMNRITSAATPVELYDWSTAILAGNIITVTGCAESAVSATDYAKVVATDNRLVNTSDCEIASTHFHVDTGAELTASRNDMEGASLSLAGLAQYDLSPYNRMVGGQVRVGSVLPGKIAYNTFENGYGLDIGYGYSRGGVERSGLSDGTGWQSPVTSTVTLLHNCIRYNTTGLQAQDIVDVSDNYWGHESGPYHARLNPTGLGDSLSGNSYLITLLGWDWHSGYCLDEAPSTPETAIVGPAGASLSWGKVQVDVPEDALAEEAAVQFLDLTDEDTGGLRRQGFSTVWLNPAPILRFDLSATRVSDGAPVTAFLRPYSLTVTYADSDLGQMDEATLQLAHVPGSQWEALPSSELDAGANRVSATLNHMSLFALVGETPTQYVFLPLVRR